MFKLTKSKPIPVSRKKHIYPFPKMAVGDSFLVPFGEVRKGHQPRVGSAAWQWGKRHKRKFSTRLDATGVRVWRTA